MTQNNQDNKICMSCATTTSSACITYYGNSYLVPPIGTDTITLCYGTSMEQAVETICNSINVLNTNVTALQASTSTIYNQPVSNICYYGLQTSYNSFISCTQSVHDNSLSTNLSFLFSTLNTANTNIAGLQKFVSDTLPVISTLYNNSGKVLSLGGDTTYGYLFNKLVSLDGSISIGAASYKVNLEVPLVYQTIQSTPALYTAIQNISTVVSANIFKIFGTIYTQTFTSGVVTLTLYNTTLRPSSNTDIYRAITLLGTYSGSFYTNLDGTNTCVGTLRFNSSTGDIVLKYNPYNFTKWSSMTSTVDYIFIPFEFSFNLN